MILDTNALSDIFKQNQSLRIHLEKADRLYLPVIALGEYLYGIKNSIKARELTELLSGLIQGIQLLVIGKDTAFYYADIRWELKQNRTPIPENDIWIAGLVREFKLPLLSRDTHFDLVEGIERLGW